LALREIEKRLGISEVIAGPVPDARNPLLVPHSYADMVRPRMMMIAAGHEDCNDIDRLRTDPAFKMACNRAPESGGDLMSQPTLSRLENAADARALYRIGMGLIDLFCRGYAVQTGVRVKIRLRIGALVPALLILGLPSRGCVDGALRSRSHNPRRRSLPHHA
jgi:hypothetical protein